MIKELQGESRLMYLVRVAIKYIEKYPDGTVDYDGTTCDGFCLLSELQDEWEDIMDRDIP